MKLIFYSNYPSICCCCSLSQFCPTLCDSMNGSMPGFPVLHCLPEFAQLLSFEYMMPSNHLILCSPLLLLPSIFSSIRVFSNESALCIRWSKYWSFSISSSSEYSGLVSLRIDWFDLLTNSPKDSQMSSPTPQLESINSSALKFLNGPTCKSVDNSYTTT